MYERIDFDFPNTDEKSHHTGISLVLPSPDEKLGRMFHAEHRVDLNVCDHNAKKGELGEREDLGKKSARTFHGIIAYFDFQFVFGETLSDQLGVLVHSVSVTEQKGNE